MLHPLCLSFRLTEPADFVSCCEDSHEKGRAHLPIQIGSDFLQGVGGVAGGFYFHSSCDYYQLVSSTSLGLCSMLGERSLLPHNHFLSFLRPVQR